MPGPATDRDRLIVALDVPTVDDARRLVATLGDAVTFYKVGLQLQYAPGGIDYVRELTGAGKRVFFDAKLYDIGETVERAVENVSRLGVDFLTIHAIGPTLRAAVAGRGSSGLKLLAVTVLTSMAEEDLADLGFAGASVEELVLRRARQTLEAGADGVIASGAEAAAIKALGDLKIVTPGIRRHTDAMGDQKRAMSPREAIRAGADHLVVGRPISKANDPRREAEAIQEEIAAALGQRDSDHAPM
jgi:orotidine-5'-phosphate decarboxylase